MSYLHDSSRKKTIAYQVGVPRKQNQNEDEKCLSTATSVTSTKRNINRRIRAICMQDSGPPGYKHNKFQTKMNGVFEEKRLNMMWN